MNENPKPIKGVEDVISELWGIADTFGHDHVYMRSSTGCSYVKKGLVDDADGIPSRQPVAPGCIVGHWLHKNGVDLTTLESNEGYIGGRWDYTYKYEVNFDLTDAALTALRVVQDLQDSGESWGSAVRRAATNAGLISNN